MNLRMVRVERSEEDGGDTFILYEPSRDYSGIDKDVAELVPEWFPHRKEKKKDNLEKLDERGIL